LASLTSGEVYGIPVLLIIGWRAEPGVPDEPQHRHQGRITEGQLAMLDIPVAHLTADTEDWKSVLSGAVEDAKEREGPVAVLVSSGTFSPAEGGPADGNDPSPTRPEAIGLILDSLPGATLFVATTGYTARELAALRVSRGEPDDRDFLAVGSMGHAGAIALGLAQARPSENVVCLDGDGSLAMHLGSLAMIGRAAPGNLGHIVFNNRVHESVGGQSTVLDRTRIADIATSCGYVSTRSCGTAGELEEALEEVWGGPGPWLIEVGVSLGTLERLPRPTDLVERKARLRARLGDD
jgi:phosphonopyruvate decarboxylase